MSREQHQAVNPGETASFICEAIGNPTPTIYWTKMADSQIIARGNKYVHNSYVCFPSFFFLFCFKNFNILKVAYNPKFDVICYQINTVICNYMQEKEMIKRNKCYRFVLC